MMQKINQAYEELSNPAKRQKYNLVWEEKYKSNSVDVKHKKVYRKNEKSIFAAKSVLDEYFDGIMNNRFDSSYELISSIDRLSITRDDFINWQRAVSMVFHLEEYSSKLYGEYKDKLLNGRIFSDVLEFSIDIIEYNAVMDMTGTDSFTKMIVLEDGKWRVFVGYKKLEPLISKFEALSSLLTAKEVINELSDRHSKVDSLTGLLNKRGLMDKVESEIHRFDRYGNMFSLIMCDINITNMFDNISVGKEVTDHAVKFAGEILVSNLRKLDVAGRWGERAFLILLPETGLASANIVTRKMRGILKSKKLVHDDKTYRVSVKFDTTEYMSSLEESLKRIRQVMG